MGDDNEVRDLAKIAKEVFLQDAEHIEAEKPKLYDMEQEFARTKANRSFRTILVTLAFVALAIGATIFLTIYIENLNKRIKIDIADFEDVTLKDLLSSARKNEDDLVNAKNAMQDTQNEIATKSQTITTAIAGKISVLDAEGLEKSDYDAQVAKLKDDEKNQQAALRASYATVLRQRQAAIDSAQKAIDAYDSKQMAAAKKQEEVLNNEQRLHDLELAKTKDQYETQIRALKEGHAQEIADLKATQERVVDAMKTKYANDVAALTLRYNPVFDTTPLKNILALPIDAKLTLILGDLTTRLTAGKYVDPKVLSGIQDTLNRRTALYERIAQIPYRNSIPSALAHLDFLDRSIIRSHEDVAGTLLSIIQAD
ncbi:MAG TPA: hypothetical protein VFH83_09275, partial [Spirochaetia bacterium]|nr:hypothetical protein [Spirochaetia bacterium]